jgi:predicted Rdx family selenoprotein
LLGETGFGKVYCQNLDKPCPTHTQNHSTMEGSRYIVADETGEVTKEQWEKLLIEPWEERFDRYYPEYVAVKDDIKAFIAKERESAERRVRQEVREKVENLWQVPPTGGVAGIVVEGNLISRKDVLDSLQDPIT